MKKPILYLIVSFAISYCSFGQNPCPVTGLDKNGNPPDERMQALDVLKNRNFKPEEEQINSKIVFDDMLNSKDDSTRFSTSDAAVIEGYIFGVNPEKGEDCNCNSTDANDWDFHVYMSIDGKAKTIADCLVIEVTPYTRQLHPTWTLDYMKSLKNKKVKVIGWMLYDYKHKGVSYETHPRGKRLDRHTVWEIHPIIDIVE